jgi:hypothetical protein
VRNFAWSLPSNFSKFNIEFFQGKNNACKSTTELQGSMLVVTYTSIEEKEICSLEELQVHVMISPKPEGMRL